MKLTVSIFILFLFASCAEHQYLTISGVDINKDNNHEFVSENDTLKLIYHFKPDQGKIMMSVFNRTGQPIVIDWWKSAITIDDKVYSFYNPDARLYGQINTDTTDLGRSVSGGSSVYVADMNGVVRLNETSQFVPSHAQIKKELFVLKLDTLKNLPENEARKDTIRVSYSEFYIYRKMLFEKDKSPLSFRSYITFHIGKGNEEKEFSLEHKFYVSEVWKIKASLQNIPENITSRGDMIYLAP